LTAVSASQIIKIGGYEMNELQDIIKMNQAHWDKEVESGDGNTIPDFDLDVDLSLQRPIRH